MLRQYCLLSFLALAFLNLSYSGWLLCQMPREPPDIALEMPTRLNSPREPLDGLIQQNEFESLNVLFNFFKQNVPTDTHVYGEFITNKTEEELRCKRYGFEYTGRTTRRRIFFGSLIADDSWHTILAHATEAYGLYHSVTLVESNATLSQERDQVRALRYPPGSLNLEVLQSGIFGRNTTVTVDIYIDRPQDRMDHPTWDGVEISQRELVSERWKQNGMEPDDIGILSDFDEVFSRDFLLAAQSCDVPEFRPNQDCHKPKIFAKTLIFESSPECITDPTERTWFHPDMILGECIDKIGDPTIHKPGKRFWNGKGPRVEGYGDNPDSYENMPNVSMYPLWKSHEIRSLEGGRQINTGRDVYCAYHFHNFFDSIPILRNKYVTYGHSDQEAASKPLGEIQEDVNLTVNCVTERPDRQNGIHRLEGGFNAIAGQKPILFQLSENYRNERQKELREMVLNDEQQFGRSS